MVGRPESVDLGGLVGACVVEVAEIVDRDDYLHGLQLVFVDGSCVLCTVWTDWTMMADRRANVAVPECFWPVEEQQRRNVLSTIPHRGGMLLRPKGFGTVSAR